MPQWFADVKAGEWLTVLAALLGPILAVQAQKMVERWRESEARRKWIFSTLMATRGARSHPDHVRALNSIELTFYRALWPSDRKVITRWREYYQQLNTPPAVNNSPTPQQQGTWDATANELFVNLLEALAGATGFKLSRDQIKTGHYSPIAHGNLENELAAIRIGLLQVLAGHRAVNMFVTNLPAAQATPAPPATQAVVVAGGAAPGPQPGPPPTP